MTTAKNNPVLADIKVGDLIKQVDAMAPDEAVAYIGGFGYQPVLIYALGLEGQELQDFYSMLFRVGEHAYGVAQKTPLEKALDSFGERFAGNGIQRDVVDASKLGLLIGIVESAYWEQSKPKSGPAPATNIITGIFGQGRAEVAHHSSSRSAPVAVPDDEMFGKLFENAQEAFAERYARLCGCVSAPGEKIGEGRYLFEQAMAKVRGAIQEAVTQQYIIQILSEVPPGTSVPQDELRADARDDAVGLLEQHKAWHVLSEAASRQAEFADIDDPKSPLSSLEFTVLKGTGRSVPILSIKGFLQDIAGSQKHDEWLLASLPRDVYLAGTFAPKSAGAVSHVSSRDLMGDGANVVNLATAGPRLEKPRGNRSSTGGATVTVLAEWVSPERRTDTTPAPRGDGGPPRS